jgi:hypothetical protein
MQAPPIVALFEKHEGECFLISWSPLEHLVHREVVE